MPANQQAFTVAFDAAQALFAAGRYREAGDGFLACLEHFAIEERETRNYAIVISNAAAAMAESGQLGNAIKLTHTAIGVLDSLPRPAPVEDIDAVARLHFNLGNMYKYQNAWNPMFDHYTRALRLYEVSSNPAGAAQCHLSLANFLMTVQDPKFAVEHLDAVDALGERFKPDPIMAWSIKTTRGMLEEKLGHTRVAIDHYRAALDAARQGGNEAYVFQAQGTLGTALVKFPETRAEGLHWLEAALAWSKQAGDRRKSPQAVALADAYLEQGDTARGLALLAEATRYVTEERLQADGPAKYLLMERDHSIALRYCATAFAADRTELSFESAEQAQGRTLLDAMFRHQLRRQQGRTIRNNVQGRITLDSPSLGQMRDWAQRTGLELFRFVLDKEQMYGWWLRPDGSLRSWKAPQALAVAARVAEALWSSPLFANGSRADDPQRTAILITEDDLPLAETVTRDTFLVDLADLYLQLFPHDVRRFIDDSSGRMAIVPHGVLWSIPFDALGTAGELPIGQHWEVTVLPSVGVALQLSPERDADMEAPDAAQCWVGGVGGASEQLVPLIPPNQGNPNGHWCSLSLPALPGAHSEAVRVGLLAGTSAVLDPHVGKDLLRTALQRARLVHLATHSVWHPLDPSRSFIVLSGGQRLDTAELLDWVSQCEVVVLSACQTAVGSSHPESPLGLASAFLTAGARSVIAALWPVSDQATRGFMEDLHVALSRLGSVPAALLEARRRAIEREGVDRPLRWAGFRLVGSPEARLQQYTALLDGPVFAGGDMVMSPDKYPAGEPLDLVALRDYRGRLGYGAIFR